MKAMVLLEKIILKYRIKLSNLSTKIRLRGKNYGHMNLIERNILQMISFIASFFSINDIF